MAEEKRAAAEAAALDRANRKMDMSAPLVWQTLSLTKEEYLPWVHDPYLYTGAQKDARLFVWDVLEPLSKTQWFTIPLVWLPVVAWLSHWYVLSSNATVLGTVLLAATGVAIWTLVEYGVHRFVFHLDDLVPDHGVAIMAHFLLHGIHHKVPMDRYRLVMPPVLFAALAGTAYCLVRPVALALVPWAHFHAIFGGVILGYVGYDMVHYSQHHMTMTLGSHWHTMKTYHMKYHYSGMQNVGYGITSKVWDVVFGTVLDVKAAKAKGRLDGARSAGGRALEAAVGLPTSGSGSGAAATSSSSKEE